MIGLLLERYWKPVYCYLRRKGYGNEPAKDLTQGFFHEVVLGRSLIERALSELKQWYLRRGMETHWQLFRDRLVRPSLEGLETPSLAQLCASRSGVKSR